MLTALIAATVLALAGPAVTSRPQDPSAAAPVEPPAAAAPEGKTVSPLVIAPQAPAPAPDLKKYLLVCHDEPVLGSLFPKQVCATQAQRKERRDIDQAEVRRWQALRPGKSN
ncbi:hypothetical protein [Phenylobacterium sp.]|uniref:hypothetical protein n=1 Tax=Phenylobacterium sp. TaxID=1871053 RepID=UPI0012266FB0|nr:hypothetical protein [Phenylobacterium sp.]THD65050.1 MAG: hypothetical protein E8A49_00635 [Phenylobacterium sp.]